MESFDVVLVKYDGLIRKVLAHMRIYENFEEFYHIAMIELWLATTTYCAEKGGFEKYAFLTMKYAIAKELSHRTKGPEVICTDKSAIFDCAIYEQEDFMGEWFEQLTCEEQQLLRWLFVVGYTNADIAQRLKVSEEAIKKRRQRLLKKLKSDISFLL